MTNIVTINLTRLEARMLGLGADAGTCDDAIDMLGWEASEKAAFRRAEHKLWQALNKTDGE